MAKFYAALTPELQAFIAAQHVFFVASAPHQGRVNLSPKGIDTLRVLGDRAIAYLDLTGSGNETAAHLEENQRLTLMWCSFMGDPLILRAYGRGTVVRPRAAAWPGLVAVFPPVPGARQIIHMDIETVQTSCGFGVPCYEYLGDRDTLPAWAEKKGEEGVRTYWQEKNQRSIDGLPTKLLSET